MSNVINPYVFGGVQPPVRSVEQVDITIGEATTATTNLTKGQNYAKCVPFITARDGGPGYLDGMNYACINCEVYDNGGTAAVRVQRNTNHGASDFEVTVFVVEFGDDISVQKISHGGAGTSWTAACTAVNQNHAFVLAYGRCDGTHDDNDDKHVKVEFNSDTELGFSRYASDGTYTGFAYIIEDATEGAHFSVQTVSDTSANSGVANKDKTLSTAVDMDTTMLLVSFRVDSGSASATYAAFAPRLHNATTVRLAHQNTSGTDDLDVHGFVVEWVDGTTVQRGVFNETSGTSAGTENKDITIAEVDLARTIARPVRHNTGPLWSGSSASGAEDEVLYRFQLTSTTNLRLQKQNTSTAAPNYVPWEVIEFAD